MDAQILKAIPNRLANDSELSDLTQEINLGNNPEHPEALSAPLVVVEPAADPDVTGLHGMAQDVEIEIKIWGYGDAMLIDASKAMERIDELLINGFDFADDSVSQRFLTSTGWQKVPGPDPQTIHLQNQYLGRYYSQNRISAIQS